MQIVKDTIEIQVNNLVGSARYCTKTISNPVFLNIAICLFIEIILANLVIVKYLYLLLFLDDMY